LAWDGGLARAPRPPMLKALPGAARTRQLCRGYGSEAGGDNLELVAQRRTLDRRMDGFPITFTEGP